MRFLHPSRHNSARWQLLQLASQIGQQQQLGAPRVVSQALSLLTAGTFPSDGSQSWSAAAQCRGAASKAGSNRVPAVPGVAVVTADRPPDILSKALAKGPAELPFAAKAYYIGAAAFSGSTNLGACRMCACDSPPVCFRMTSNQ